jgi:hypothetical protein
VDGGRSKSSAMEFDTRDAAPSGALKPRWING